MLQSLHSTNSFLHHFFVLFSSIFFFNLETRHFFKRAALCIGELQNRVLFNIQTRAYQTLCRKDSQQKKRSSLLKDECEERERPVFFHAAAV